MADSFECYTPSIYIGGSDVRSIHTVTRIGLAVGLVIGSLPLAAVAQQGAADGQWRHYGGDHGSTKYAPLDQITAQNVADLEIAWRWTSPDEAIAKANNVRHGRFVVTPLMVDGVLYVSTGLSQVAAVDAGTGETIWVHDPKAYKRGRPTNVGFQHRGVEYWTDGEDERIIIATGTRQLIALNAKTGEPYPDFGDGGWVDLGKGLGRAINERNLGYNAPPIVVGDTIVLGSIISDTPGTKTMPPGYVRGFDVRTGAQKWSFHTIPQQGEFGNETWKDDSWKYSGNTNVWSMMSADDELGYVYLPTSTPTNDWYGGHRKGDNLFAESLVCLNAETGERVWYFQAVHHGLWDYDFPCAPILMDIVVDGKPIKAVAQLSKQGFCYVFDRVTGEPVWPIEERPVPQTTVPGEYTSPTQPHPTKPAAFERQGVTEDDLIDFTPELRAEAVQILKKYVHGPLFTPPSLLEDNGTQGTILMPGPAGGANWGGGSFDPETGLLYIPSKTLPYAIGVRPADANRTDFKYIRDGNPFVLGPQGLPLIKPPYSRITAIDMNTGEHVWMVPHGNGPVNHPALSDLNPASLGQYAVKILSTGGPVLTKSLLFLIQDPSDTMGAPMPGYFRAFDKATGEVVHERQLEVTPHGTLMTYMDGGKQYIVFGAGGNGRTAELIALALP
ncbi:MAG: pyrroloquinoline quinone-dependent dehydrogenase [Candidatus Hydrogenedentes bacterium]|nr:pyrroloquinoline quinone-dependent dehydrogenase [Candidatus Hydrogenedentota bacterium]